MVVGAKVCELTDGFLWFVCVNSDVPPLKLTLCNSFLQLSDIIHV